MAEAAQPDAVEEPSSGDDEGAEGAAPSTRVQLHGEWGATAGCRK